MFRPIKFFVVFLTFIFLSSTHAYSLELLGQNFPDSIQLAGKDLTLNGLGSRISTIFYIKVYVAGLYLEQKTQDAEAAVSSSEHKQLEIRFLKQISRSKLRRAWIDGFESNNENLNPIRERITVFSKSMTTLKPGDVLILDFIADKTQVYINGKLVTEILGADFSQALLKIWLGKNPPNKSLKKGLLGIQ